MRVRRHQAGGPRRRCWHRHLRCARRCRCAGGRAGCLWRSLPGRTGRLWSSVRGSSQCAHRGQSSLQSPDVGHCAIESRLHLPKVMLVLAPFLGTSTLHPRATAPTSEGVADHGASETELELLHIRTRVSVHHAAPHRAPTKTHTARPSGSPKIPHIQGPFPAGHRLVFFHGLEIHAQTP